MSQPSRDSIRDIPVNQRVSLHAMATACCEGVGESDKGHCSLEKYSVADGWISVPVQTFGLSVEPVHLEDYKVTCYKNNSHLVCAQMKLIPVQFSLLEFELSLD